MRKPKPSDKRKTKAPSARRPSHARNETMCAICGKPMGTEEEWVGNIEAALSLLNRNAGGSRKIHRPCGELVPKLIAPDLPKLKLQPYPFRWSRRGGPNPDVTVCLWYFEKCQAARSQENAAQQISDLLLEFEDKYPIEWECSGWKDTFVAGLVLGTIQRGEFRERRGYAERWFSRRWKQKGIIDRQMNRDLASKSLAAVEAAFDLTMIDLGVRCAAAGDAVRRGDSVALDAAWDKSVDYPQLLFIRWLNKHWEDLSKFGEVDPSRTFKPVPPSSEKELFSATVKNFRKEGPNCDLTIRDLADIFFAFREVSRRRALPLKPSDVLLKFVATRHKITDAKLRHYLAETGKRAQRPKRPRGKSARPSDRP